MSEWSHNHYSTVLYLVKMRAIGSRMSDAILAIVWYLDVAPSMSSSGYSCYDNPSRVSYTESVGGTLYPP